MGRNKIKGTCQLCLQFGMMADSHIWPKALVHDLVDDPGTEAIYAIPLSPTEREKRRRTGIWDDTIMCEGCEDRFKSYDDFGVSTLRIPAPVAGETFVHRRLNVDPKRFKLFFLHVLWRSHASSSPELAGAKMAPQDAERLRQMLLRDDAGSLSEFATMLHVLAPDPDGMDTFSTSFAKDTWTTGVERFRMRHQRWQVFVTPSLEGPPTEFLPVMLGSAGTGASVVFGGDNRQTDGFLGLVNSIEGRRRNPPPRPDR